MSAGVADAVVGYLLFALGCAGIVWWLCRPEQPALTREPVRRNGYVGHPSCRNDAEWALLMAEVEGDWIKWSKEMSA